MIQKIKEKMREKFPHFQKLNHFKFALSNIYLTSLQENEINIEMKSPEKWTALYYDHINPPFVRKVYERLTGKKWNEDTLKEILALVSAKVTAEQYLTLKGKEREEMIAKGLQSINQSCVKKYVIPRTKIQSKQNVSQVVRVMAKRHKESEQDEEKIRV